MQQVKIQKNLMSDQVYRRIKELIIANQLKPNEKLNLAQLAEEMQTSKAPVSLALSRLQDDGYVVVLPQSGTFVRRLSTSELNIIYKSRASLEQLIVETYGDRLQPADLRQAREAFQHYAHWDHYSDAIHRELFDLDMRFHELLVSVCDEIIRREVQNITDLTKRSRLLLLKAVYTDGDRAAMINNNVRCHLEIIDALLRHDTTAAGERVYHDVIATWTRISALTDIIG